MSEVMLSEIRIGTRHRKHLGDIPALAKSIEEIGLLHPVVVTPDLDLIAGRRRLEAVKALGWTKVPVHVVSLEEALRGEHAENVQRKDFTPSEAVAIGRALEALEKQKAKERQKATRLAGKAKQAGDADGSGNLPEPSGKGQVRDKVAAAVGMSGRTYDKAKAVVEAAEADPEVNGPLVEEMDRSGNVHAAYTAMVQPEESAGADVNREHARRLDRGLKDFLALTKEFRERGDFWLAVREMSDAKLRRLIKQLSALPDTLYSWINVIDHLLLTKPTHAAAVANSSNQDGTPPEPHQQAAGAIGLAVNEVE
jgi:ParB family chromosome partitioning protein